jgi:hypothetical protein
MKKLLPYAPMFALIFGLFIVQAGNHTSSGTLLSSTLWTSSGSESIKVCAKPEQFSDTEESAWCNIWIAADITNRLNTWGWLCIVGEEKYSCHFTENTTYKTRGGILFSK